jgi:hypothetical protein
MVEILSRDAAPTNGFWRRGTMVMNANYAAGEPQYWVCTVTGEPGTWVPFYGPNSEATETPTAAGIGAGSGTNVTAVETAGVLHRTVVTFAATPFPVTDALAYAGLKVYTFPAGRIYLLGTTASIQWAVTSVRASTINLNAAFDWSVGTATASSVTLASTMVDLLPKIDKTLSEADAGLNTASTGALAAPAVFDGTTTAIEAYLNGSFPTTTEIDADGTMTATGTVTLTWVNLGDF